jgi:hypothetical protein
MSTKIPLTNTCKPKQPCFNLNIKKKMLKSDSKQQTWSSHNRPKENEISPNEYK